MPNPNVPIITPPRVPLVDFRTGMIDRAWYLFFLSLNNVANAIVDDPALGTSSESLIASYDAMLQTLAQEVQTQPTQESAIDQIAELQKQIDALALQARPELGTMSQLQQDNVPWLRFDTTPTGFPTSAGSVYWDEADRSKTLALVMEDTGNIIQDIGEETFYRVKATSAITKGQVVMFTGTVGASGGLLAAPATGLTAFQNEYIMGIATQDIALNAWGYVTWFGEVDKVNTTGGAETWVDGQILYYNPAVAGGLTKTVPTAPNPKVIVASVVHAASNGILFVRPTFGSALGATDSNVEITGLTNGDMLVYDSADQRWENRAQSTLVAGRADNISGGAAGSVPYQTAPNITGMLSIGAANTVLTSSGAAPQWSTGLALTSASSIEVTDNSNAALRITQLGTGNALLVEDSANPDASPFVVTADGRVITGTTQAYAADGDTQQIQVHGLTQASSSALLANWSATATSEPNLVFAHSRSGVVGTHTASVNNDNLGTIVFCGSDGSVFGEGVTILAEAAGTWSGSSRPASLEFYTVPSGATGGLLAISLTSGQGLQIARTAVTSPVADDGNVFSGTYTPTLTNTTNIAASTANICQYMRVGNVVTVSGTVVIDPTATGRIVLGLSLPIASALTLATQCGGTFASAGTTTVNVGSVTGDATNDRATFDGVVADAASRTYAFTFTYRVL